MIGHEQPGGGGHGVRNGCNGIGTGQTVIGGSPICETNGMCFRLPTYAKHDPPIVVHYGQTRDIESQSAFETEVRPSVPPFTILFLGVTVTQLIISFCLSVIIWCFRLGG